MWFCPKTLHCSHKRVGESRATGRNYYWLRRRPRTTSIRSRSRSPHRANRGRRQDTRRRSRGRLVFLNWNRQPTRVKALIGEVCEALLDLDIYDETPATKAEIVKEMDERITKQKVIFLFRRERPNRSEFDTALKFGLTYGFIKYHGRNDNGIPIYDLEADFKEFYYHVRGDFEEAVASLDDPIQPPEPMKG